MIYGNAIITNILSVMNIHCLGFDNISETIQEIGMKIKIICRRGFTRKTLTFILKKRFVKFFWHLVGSGGKDGLNGLVFPASLLIVAAPAVNPEIGVNPESHR